MRSFVVAVAVFACACGEVVKVPDAGNGDANDPDGPDEVTCGAGEMSCNGTCANLMTSELFCGNCTTQCTPIQGCLNGTCVPANVSCSRVRELDPAATDGVYRNPNTGASLYCSFTQSLQWEIVTNPYTSPPAGFSIARAADFGGAAFQQAFMALYNHDVGIRAFSTFTFANCCMGPLANVRYSLGPSAAQILWVGMGAGSFCNQQVTQNTYLTFGVNGSNFMPSLPATYFSTNTFTELSAQCSDSNNVAWWYRRTAI